MLLVALTGGIGAGKSLVAGYFADLGARVVDADQLSRVAIERGSKGFDAVVAEFGDEILRSGDIDRRALGEKVFNNANARAKLEAIIHPLVRTQFDDLVSSLREHEIMIYEIPLLVETHAQDRFNVVITVESDSTLRESRLRERGLLQSEIASRMSAQASSAERIAVADYVIENNASTDQLLRQVEHLWEIVLPSLERENS
ncbi:MAG: dephospho-CoA kinase [Actinobacteria bacterium]|nr:dephospho-CoA kinase [Actinomycetota bacterium]